MSKQGRIGYAVEAIALLVLVGVAVSLGARQFFEAQESPVARDLRTRFGPQRNTGHLEEWIIRDSFQDRRGGVFLDVGANHHQHYSNTFFLETALGWSGIAIDPQEQFAAGCTAHRPRTRFVAMFASDVPDTTARLFVPENSLVASVSEDFTKRYGKAGVAREVPTTTLNKVLEEAGIVKVDFLSMDIELAEPKALAGFDIDRYRPDLVCIEAHPEVRQQILDYFAAHRYALIDRYLEVDDHNLYFRPAKF